MQLWLEKSKAAAVPRGHCQGLDGRCPDGQRVAGGSAGKEFEEEEEVRETAPGSLPGRWVWKVLRLRP